jgi:hypothetical protein
VYIARAPARPRSSFNLLLKHCIQLHSVIEFRIFSYFRKTLTKKNALTYFPETFHIFSAGAFRHPSLPRPLVQFFVQERHLQKRMHLHTFQKLFTFPRQAHFVIRRPKEPSFNPFLNPVSGVRHARGDTAPRTENARAQTFCLTCARFAERSFFA